MIIRDDGKEYYVYELLESFGMNLFKISTKP